MHSETALYTHRLRRVDQPVGMEIPNRLIHKEKDGPAVAMLTASQMLVYAFEVQKVERQTHP